MKSIRLTFNRAAQVKPGVSLFVAVLMMLAIDDDRQRAEKQQREKRERAARPQRKPAPPAC